jgi:hypothetical protein
LLRASGKPFFLLAMVDALLEAHLSTAAARRPMVTWLS